MFTRKSRKSALMQIGPTSCASMRGSRTRPSAAQPSSLQRDAHSDEMLVVKEERWLTEISPVNVWIMDGL